MSEASITQRLREGLDKQYLDILENGEVLTDAGGNVILDGDNNPLRRPPSAAMMNSIRAWYKERITQGGDKKDVDPIEAAMAEIRSGRSTGGDIPPITDDDDPAT